VENGSFGNFFWGFLLGFVFGFFLILIAFVCRINKSSRNGIVFGFVARVFLNVAYSNQS
jgi:hypothetical protein